MSSTRTHPPLRPAAVLTGLLIVAVVTLALIIRQNGNRASERWTFDRPRADAASWQVAQAAAGVPLFRPTRLPPHTGQARLEVRGVIGDPTRPVALVYPNGLHIVEAHRTVDPQLKDADEVVAGADEAWSAKVARTETLFVRRGTTLAVLYGRPLDEMISVADWLKPVHAGASTRSGEVRIARPPDVRSSTYLNPVIHTDFADPTILHATDGWYYAYSTESLTIVRMAYIQVARSRDLVHWQLLPDALPIRPRWASRMRDFWAPGVIEADGTYYLYFAAMPNSEKGMCIGVATSRRPRGPFRDAWKPLACSDGFADIDPMPFDDPITGKHLLYWGSDRQPLRVQELAPNRKALAWGSTAKDILFPNGIQPYETLIEAPFVMRHGPYYYLFYSGDNCCGEVPTYAVMVARARHAMGPFVPRASVTHKWGASVIIHFNDAWDAPGHNAVIHDRAGHDWLVYHAINIKDRLNPGTESVRRPMLIDRIVWRGGWPTIRRDVPSISPQPVPITH